MRFRLTNDRQKWNRYIFFHSNAIWHFPPFSVGTKRTRPHLTMNFNAREQSVGAFAPNEFAHFLLRNNVCNLSSINIRIYIGQWAPISATKISNNWTHTLSVRAAREPWHRVLVVMNENKNMPMCVPICGDAHYEFALKSIEFLRQSNGLDRHRTSEQRKSKLNTHFVFILFDEIEFISIFLSRGEKRVYDAQLNGSAERV